MGSQKAFHPEGELATARAAKAKKGAQMLSTATSTPVEDVARKLGTPPWFQLYTPLCWEETEKLVKRAEAAGCSVLAWTIDLLAGRNTETATRFERLDHRVCASCHADSPTGQIRRGWLRLAAAVTRFAGKPMFSGLSGGVNPPQATWSYVDRVDAVGAQIRVLADGGFRSGSDVYKALAIGARAVGIGRPYIYGLASFGQEGVERVLDIPRGADADDAPVWHAGDCASHARVRSEKRCAAVMVCEG